MFADKLRFQPRLDGISRSLSGAALIAAAILGSAGAASAQAIPRPGTVVWPESGGTMKAIAYNSSVFKGVITSGGAETSGSLSGAKKALLNSANVRFGPYNLSLSNVGGFPPYASATLSHTYTVAIWGSNPGQVASSAPLSFVKLGEVTKTLTAQAGKAVTDKIYVDVVMPSVFMDIKVVATFSPGPWGPNPGALINMPKVMTYPSTTCGSVTPGLSSTTDACMQGAINPTGLIVPDVMPLSIIYEPPGSGSWSNMVFSGTTGSAFSMTQTGTTATNVIWNYSAAGGLLSGSSNTTQTIVGANSGTHSFSTKTTSAFGTILGLPGGPSVTKPRERGPGIGDQFVFVLQPTFLYWDTAGQTNFRLSTKQVPGHQETIAVAYVHQIDPARPSKVPGFLSKLTPTQLQAVRSLDPFAKVQTGPVPAAQPTQPMACSSGLPLSTARFVYMGRRNLSVGSALQVTQGTAIDSSMSANMSNGMTTVTSSQGNQAAKNASLVVGAFAAAVVGGGGAFETFGKASSAFDQFVLHDETTTTVTQTLTTDTLATKLTSSTFAQSFLIRDSAREVDVDLYYDTFFGTIAFNELPRNNPPSGGQAGWCSSRVAPGDVNGDRISDLTVLNPNESRIVNGYGSTARDGGFTARYASASNFTALFNSGAKAVQGDFDGDGLTDIALTGVSGWASVPVAFAKKDGTYRITNSTDVGSWPAWAVDSWAQLVTGDFNGDGRDDLAMAGSFTWGDIKLALSRGDGSFDAKTWTTPNATGWSRTTGAQLVPGDFNGDGYGDLAITGPSIWGSVPIFMSTGSGFTEVNKWLSDFPLYASMSTAIPGDFNGDGLGDIALAGNSSWGSIPVALANEDGSFRMANIYMGPDFPTYSGLPGSQLRSGDFNGDGRSDIVAAGGLPGGYGSPLTFFPVAMSNGTDGTFVLKTKALASADQALQNLSSYASPAVMSGH